MGRKRPTITVVIPTVTGRESSLERAIAAYEANTASTFELLTFKDRPGVAYGWQLGAEAARGRYIQLANDDNEVRPGWDEAAIRCVDEWEAQPAPRVFDPDGSPWAGGVADQDPRFLKHGAEVPLSTIPFLARAWWPAVTPLPPGMHYFTDNWIGWRLQAARIPTRVCHGYDVVHSWARAHRGAGWSEPQRMGVDQQYATLAASIIKRGAESLAAPDTSEEGRA